MDTYDSDSSGLDDGDADVTETAVLLGYASEEATDDSISRLGGWPVRIRLPTGSRQLIKSLLLSIRKRSLSD
jgi:hypothetical protein